MAIIKFHYHFFKMKINMCLWKVEFGAGVPLFRIIPEIRIREAKYFSAPDSRDSIYFGSGFVG